MSRKHSTTVEYDGVVFDVTFTAWGNAREWGIEDVQVVGVEDPAPELHADAENAAYAYIEGAVDYQRSGF